MGVSLHIQRTFKQESQFFNLDVRLETQAQRIAILGPSGSGKTLTLQSIAGLIRPEQGYIQVHDTCFFCSERKVNMAPQARRLAYLQQDYALLPHLTVAQNISFGLKKGWFNPSRKWVSAVAQYWIEAFELQPILGSYPHEISGGQKQRTALARALVLKPDLILLDEPLAALDMGLRVRMRQELLQVQQRLKIPSIIITHDPEDAVVLADEIYMMAAGSIQGRCAPNDLQDEIALSTQRLEIELQQFAQRFN